MLMNRILGAFMFKKEVYAEVENDASFTSTAWTLVAVVAFLVQLGTNSVAATTTGWIIGTIIGTIVSLVAFAVGAFLIAWVGKSLFNATVTFEEMVRTLGLAYVWTIVGAVALLGSLSDTLACVLTPALCIGAILGLVSWFIAAREALDLDTGQTLITVIVGWVASFLVTLIVGGILAGLGLGAAALGGALGQ
jgi:hypothetical protein